jgi:hypothetical protein
MQRSLRFPAQKGSCHATLSQAAQQKIVTPQSFGICRAMCMGMK